MSANEPLGNNSSGADTADNLARGGTIQHRPQPGRGSYSRTSSSSCTMLLHKVQVQSCESDCSDQLVMDSHSTHATSRCCNHRLHILSVARGVASLHFLRSSAARSNQNFQTQNPTAHRWILPVSHSNVLQSYPSPSHHIQSLLQRQQQSTNLCFIALALPAGQSCTSRLRSSARIMQSPNQQQHSAASTAQNSPAAPVQNVPHPALTNVWGSLQPASMLTQVEDMLISPRVDTHSPHWRSFPVAPADEVTLETDTCSRRDQNRTKPRFSTSSLPDVMDW
jgi:hypothetical protein